jgi:selenocysteine lyase/cysteine desulfurase
MDPAPLVSNLLDQGVICSARDRILRLTTHFYNHEDDIVRLAGALTRVR